jgi:hypothetical protein
VLGNFQNQSVLDAFDLQGVEDGGDFALELHVHDGSDDLRRAASTWEICPFFREMGLAAVAKPDLRVWPR